MKDINLESLSREELILLLIELSQEFPNDYDLGKKIRSLIKNN